MTKTDLGINLKKIKESKGITNYTLINFYLLKDKSIKNIENGNSNYTIDSLLIYLDAIKFELQIKEIEED